MIPNNYWAADSFLNGKNNKVVRGKRATYVTRLNDTSIALVYHHTPVVTWHSDGNAVLQTNGHYSLTTKKRINQAISGHVYQQKRCWYYSKDGNVVPFKEGMSI